jgi:hypothetical protein
LPTSCDESAGWGVLRTPIRSFRTPSASEGPDHKAPTPHRRRSLMLAVLKASVVCSARGSTCESHKSSGKAGPTQRSAIKQEKIPCCPQITQIDTDAEGRMGSVTLQHKSGSGTFLRAFLDMRVPTGLVEHAQTRRRPASGKKEPDPGPLRGAAASSGRICRGPVPTFTPCGPHRIAVGSQAAAQEKYV